MKITLIQTGGTIDKDYPKTTKGYAFSIEEPAAQRILEKMPLSIDYEVITAFKKDSLEITKEDREQLSQICQEIQNDKIIITHGTDTLIETARFLEHKSIPSKTIVLTGAHLPERFYHSDAIFHLAFAVGIVQVLPFGVYVAMNGRYFQANQVQRNMETGLFY